jgi:truncated hemoglobin YjbI
MRKWFKLTIPKGKRKKRAHKKWMKKHGINTWLRNMENHIEENIDTPTIEKEIMDTITRIAIYGE